MEAQRNFAVLLVALLLAVGLPLYIAVAQSEREPIAALLPGDVWERGDGLGYNVSLYLGKSGRYVARWTGCLGEYGRSEGIWGETQDGIELKPSREDGMMQGHLKHLKRVALGGEVVLIPLADLDRAERFDVGEPFSNFYAFKLRR